ncbi:small GTP-binding protein, putative [Trichomonas vaginalis G3]|uniref:Small GTP-binding protein, putative n=1 Tax=Trichomonas vaginalis (strain ATCC PRA-98 / G3) TaxID=412133 RepID=A2EEB3_TRIV3|nr:regulation of endocytosis [Trichomonas vaginalis G3]EAY09011.1 small GTP-binding protein, putative [Trichomonas vaginalis G3]KAI5496280.1 regulation of endocytosis [Trichomonas vaginalis G3]|eukprot:XP_001321234.1 small GTP-binding protein [Trichomonas vaginalis G3]
MVENVDFFKFIVIGSTGVGKTCIMKRMTENEFRENTLSTTGVEFDSTKVDVDGKEIPIQIWDTAGQERFRSISRAYFRNAIGVLLVFSLTDKESFEEIGGWLNDARTLCCQDAEIMLIGNKCDIPDQRLISLADAQNFADSRGLHYIETSAKTGQNVREAFSRIASEVIRKLDKNSTDITGRKLTVTDDEPKKGCC